MTKQQKIILFGGLGLTATSYLVYQNMRQNQIFTEMVGLINSGSARSNKRVDEVLSGVFHQDVKSLNPDRNFIMLSEDKVREYVVKIEDAITGWGTDESALKGIIQLVRDKIAFSQIASFYFNKYNQSLKEVLKEDLSQEEYLKEVVIPINLKKDVRWSN